MPEMNALLTKVVNLGASDLLISPNEPPMIRLDGKMQRMTDFPKIDAAECKRMVYSILTPYQTAKFEKTYDLDISYSLPGVTRFRVSVFVQSFGIACAMRPMSPKIPTPEQLGLTSAVLKLAELPRGLILITGPTGSGKTTTMASLLDHINQCQHKNIVTIEDPIEFIFQNKGSVVNQREVGVHTPSFSQGLRGALRQNPDIIMIGEMRDLETIELAVRAAETGHLCISTLHTLDAPSTIDRIISELPSAQQGRMRMQLANVLSGVVSQVLLPKIGGGRVCAREIMIMNSGIANLIREGKIFQILGSIESAGAEGMCVLDQSLAKLVSEKIIDFNTAFAWCHDLANLKNILSGMGIILPGPAVVEYVAPV